MRNLLPKSAFLIFIALSLLPQWAFSTDLYVDAGGNNTTNNCQSSGSPCATITYALTQAAPGDVIIAIGNLTGDNAGIVIDKSITLRGRYFNVKPVLSTTAVHAPRGVPLETQLTFANGKYISINNSVNDVTIEGFTFVNTTDDDTDAIIMFQANGTNNNIVISRNILAGTETERRRFIFKNNDAGNLTNIKITENLIVGSGSSFSVAAIDIRKAGIGVNEIRGNVIGTNYNQPTYRTQKGIELSNVTNFTIAENEFRYILASPIQIISVNTGGNVVIEFNTLIESNTGGFITEPNIAAGILLRASAIDPTTSLIIRNNDFQGNNRFAIAIPAAYNNFSTNGIQIIENRLAGTNGNADLYVGNSAVTLNGKINTNGNWWGHNIRSRPTASTTGGPATDILGNAGARSKVFPSVWLNSSTDIGGVLPGFISDKVVTVDIILPSVQAALKAVPENWTLLLQNNTYYGTYTIENTSFTLDGESSNISIENLEIDAPGKIITLKKPFNICVTCDDQGINSSSLTLTAGKIQLDNYDLILGDINTINGGDQNSYIITNSTGRLVQKEVGSINIGDRLFPIGPDNASYTPIVINNDTGTPDDFSASVQSVTSITDNNGFATTNIVGLIWDISEGAPGGSDVTLTLQWDGDPVSSGYNELLGFDHTKCYITHFNGTIWENEEWPATTAVNVPSTDFWTQTAYNVDNFSPFAVAGVNAALPVDLLKFNAQLQQTDVLLNWTTASETDNDYFAVERSADGKIFSEIGKLKGKGTVNGFNNYTFTDDFATETGHDILYYRLKQVDTDGTFTYSKIQNVALHTWAVRLFPNPANQFINITSPGKTQVQVINSQGQAILQKEFNDGTILNISTLTKGIYIFRFSDGKHVNFKKISVL